MGTAPAGGEPDDARRYGMRHGVEQRSWIPLGSDARVHVRSPDTVRYEQQRIAHILSPRAVPVPTDNHPVPRIFLGQKLELLNDV